MNAPKKIWVYPYNMESSDNDWVSIEPVLDGDVPYIRADLVDGLMDELKKAAYVFRVYQAHHEAKGDMTKAEANGAYAKAIEDALKAMEEE